MNVNTVKNSMYGKLHYLFNLLEDLVMEILNNFASIYCYIAFVIGAVFMLAMLSIAAMSKVKEPRNKVRFFITRDSNYTNRLKLWLGNRNGVKM